MKVFLYSWRNEDGEKETIEVIGAKDRNEADEIMLQFEDWCPHINRFLNNPIFAEIYVFKVEEKEDPTFH